MDSQTPFTEQAKRLVERRSFLQTVGAGVGASALFPTAAAAPADERPWNGGGSTLWGESHALGDGEIQTFVDFGDAVERMGIWVSEAALQGLPSLEELLAGGAVAEEIHLDFPEPPGAAGEAFNFTFAGVDWNPGGHDPLFVYGKPHFDFHFYYQDEETTEQIPLGVADYEIPDPLMPEGYVTPAAFGAPRVMVPGMGEHLGDPSAPEFQPGGEFTKTFIWGAYDPGIDPENPDSTEEILLELPGIGTMTQEVGVYSGDGTGDTIFMEPMITKAYLEELSGESRESVSMPSVFPEAGSYPTEYVVNRRSDPAGWTVTLETFEQFEGFEGC